MSATNINYNGLGMMIFRAGVGFGFGLPSDESLVGYWAFDDGSGSVAVDGSGNGNDGELINSPDWVDGVVGKCLSFDGTDEYVDCGDVDDLGDTFSISLWVNVAARGASYLPLVFRDGNTYNNVGLRLDHIGKIEFRQYGGDEISYATPLSLSTWYHIIVTCDALEGKIYVDGEYKTGGTFGASFVDTGDITIGRYNYSGGYFLNGLIDEVRIYSTALTASEVKALYLYPGGK